MTVRRFMHDPAMAHVRLVAVRIGLAWVLLLVTAASSFGT